MSSTTPPGVYRHRNGSLYRALFTADLASNGDREGFPVVVYVSMNSGLIYVRDEGEFHEIVTSPDEAPEPRFKLILRNEQ